MTLKWLCLRMPFLPTALSCVPFVTKLVHVRFMMSCATMGTGKSTLLTFIPFPLSDHNPPKTARSSRKRTAGGVSLALRKYHRHLPTPYIPQMTRTRKVQSCARRARRMHHVVHAEHVTPNYGGKHRRACQRPCCAMLAVSRGASTQT